MCRHGQLLQAPWKAHNCVRKNYRLVITVAQMYSKPLMLHTSFVACRWLVARRFPQLGFCAVLFMVRILGGIECAFLVMRRICGEPRRGLMFRCPVIRWASFPATPVVMSFWGSNQGPIQRSRVGYNLGGPCESLAFLVWVTRGWVLWKRGHLLLFNI